MRLFIAIVLICILGCGGGNDTPVTYPQPVATGTFYGFDVRGQNRPHIVLIYADENGQMQALNLDQEIVSTMTHGPLYAGNRITITRVGPNGYDIKKEE